MVFNKCNNSYYNKNLPPLCPKTLTPLHELWLVGLLCQPYQASLMETTLKDRLFFTHAKPTYSCLDSFSDDQIEIIWALLYMKSGRAAKWAAYIFTWEEENEGYARVLEWDNFKSEFHKEFCSANSNSTAINKLESITYYQRTWSVDDYLDEFLDLITESGYMDPKTLVVKFLDLQIQNAVAKMTNRHPSDTTLTAWHEAARNIDQNRASNEAFWSTHHTLAFLSNPLHPSVQPTSNPLRHMSGQPWVIQFLWTLMQVGKKSWSLQHAIAAVRQAIKSWTALYSLTYKH